MSNFLIAFLCGISALAWTYNKFMKTTGGNSKNAIGGSAVVGFLAFLTIFIIASFIN